MVMVQILERTSTAQTVLSKVGTDVAIQKPTLPLVGTLTNFLAELSRDANTEPMFGQRVTAEPQLRQQVAQFFIQGGLAEGYYLQVALPARVWMEEEGDYVAEQPNLRLIAFGGDEVEALLNLGGALVEQLELLNSMGEKLSPALKRDRAMLRTAVLSNAKP